MSQKVIYREMAGFNEFEECYRLQKEVFHLSDKDVLPPVFINLLTRKNPRTGIAIGAFDKSKLIGYSLCVSANNNDSIYGMSFGVLPDYLKTGVGLGLNVAVREHALKYNINTFYCIYESLEGNLGNLYLDKFGMIGVKYEPEVYELGDHIPIDKVLMKWDFNSERTKKKLSKEYEKEPLDVLLKNTPIARVDFNEICDKMLVEIPDDFLKIKSIDKDNAMSWRMKTRTILNEFLNKRNYQITEFYTKFENKNRENYYLIEKAT